MGWIHLQRGWLPAPGAAKSLDPIHGPDRRCSTLHNIQALRFFAAVIVVAYHFNGVLSHIVKGWDFPILDYVGYIGVDLFFVISGAIMWHTTKWLYGYRDSTGFLFRRFVRIFPVYWIFLALQTSVWLCLQPSNLKWVNFTKAITLVPASHYFIGVAWTLTYELIFYIVFALLILLPRKRASMIIAFAAAAIIGMTLMGLDRIVSRHVSLVFFLEFFGGCAAASLACRHPVYLARLAVVIGTAVAAFGVAWQYHTGKLIDHPEWLRVMFFGLASMLIVYGAIGLERSRRVTAPQPLARAGDWSYTIYLLHGVAMTAANLGFEGQKLFSLPLALQGIVLLGAVSVVVLISAVFAEWIELPLYRYLKGITVPSLVLNGRWRRATESSATA